MRSASTMLGNRRMEIDILVVNVLFPYDELYLAVVLSLFV